MTDSVLAAFVSVLFCFFEFSLCQSFHFLLATHDWENQDSNPTVSSVTCVMMVHNSKPLGIFCILCFNTEDYFNDQILP